MWERGARHNPVSLRYRWYADHRPFLPQDPTLGFLRQAEGSYESIYFIFRIAKDQLKYIYSNNMPVKDREELKNLMRIDNLFRSNFSLIAGISTLFLGTGIFKSFNFGSSYFKRGVVLYLTYKTSQMVLNKFYTLYYNDFATYYYNKYAHIATDNKEETKDKRREFIQLDTSVYYRESSQDIRHNAHHPASHGHHDHDTSTYYGPYPVR